jgi:hypothetical protein
MSTLNFELRYPEKEEFNQYWYSKGTITSFLQEIEQVSEN